MQSESWATNSSLSFFKYAKLKGLGKMGQAFLPGRRPFRKLAAISKREIYTHISKAACDVKQNPFLMILKIWQCSVMRRGGRSLRSGRSWNQQLIYQGAVHGWKGPGCGAVDPGFKFWLHHSTNCAAWGKFCVTSPNQYESHIHIYHLVNFSRGILK